MNCSPPGSSVHGDYPGKNTGVGCHALQEIFPTQPLNPGLLQCSWILYHLSHQVSFQLTCGDMEGILCPPVQICPHALHLPWCHLPWKVTSSYCVWSSSLLCFWDPGSSTSRSPGVWGPRMAGGGDGSIGRARPEGGPWRVRQEAV